MDIGAMKMRFISAKLCPFAQRNIIVLRAKHVDCEVAFIDLFDKPAWLLELSPAGKVPLLEVDGELLSESNVISEFFDEIFLTPNLHPDAPLRRARHRVFIEAVSPLNMDVHRIMMAPDEATAMEAVASTRQRLTAVEPYLEDGPLFGRANLSLVDVAAAPALVRLAWCAAIEPTTNAAAGLSAVERWQATLMEHDAVRGSMVEGLHELWLRFLQGGGSPKRKAPPTWLGRKSSPLDAGSTSESAVGTG